MERGDMVGVDENETRDWYGGLAEEGRGFISDGL